MVGTSPAQGAAALIIDTESMVSSTRDASKISTPTYSLFIQKDLGAALRDKLAALPHITLRETQSASPASTLSAGSQTTKATLAASHDFPGNSNIRFFDARDGDPLLLNSQLTRDTQESQGFPILLLVDPETLPAEFLERLDVPDLVPLELVSANEVGSELFNMRLRLLATRGQPITGDIVQDNAHTILQQVMTVCNDWMVLKSVDNRFLLATNNFCHAFSLPLEDVIGKNDIEIGTAEELVLGKPGTDWKGYWELDKEIMESGKENILQPVVLGDDETNVTRERTVRTPLRDRNGHVFGMLVCVSEFTHSKDGDDKQAISVATALQKASVARSPALLALQREKNCIDELRRASENAFIAKNQFIASASHDLRQPLHALGLFISALERRETDTVTKNLIEKLKHCSESINDLLNGLLDISQLDANVVSVDLRHFAIDELFVTLFDELITRADNKKLDFQVHSDQSIVCSDTLLLGRILRNLLTNAINYTDSGQVVMYAQRNLNQVELNVVDTGCGIPEKQQEAVFKEFHQLTPAEGAKTGGLGLGLAIVRRLCLLLDIELRLESSSGSGTRFTLLLPLGERSKVDPLISTTDADPDVLDDFSANVMVVDDDGTVREAVEVILLANSCPCMTAESPEDALKIIQRSAFEPDLILADFRLKNGETGIEAVTQIRSFLKLTVPAIIITGDTSDIGLQELNRSGIRYLHKPVAAPELMGAIKSLLMA